MSTPKEMNLVSRMSPRDLVSSRCNDSTYGTGDLLNLGGFKNKSNNIESLIDNNIKTLLRSKLTNQTKLTISLTSYKQHQIIIVKMSMHSNFIKRYSTREQRLQ